MRHRLKWVLFILLAILPKAALALPLADWPSTEGAAGGGRYSPLAEINRDNVSQLQVAWTYRHGDVKKGGFLPDRVNRGTAFEGTPIVVGGRLIFTTPFNRVIALDPTTGEELWSYDPKIDTGEFYANMIINRGVGYWPGKGDAGVCAARVMLATLDRRLIALDAATGRPCEGFGSGGIVDLETGIEPLVDPREFNVTSPPLVVGDVVIVGSSIADLVRRRSPPGDVRAFDIRTGALAWTFHTIPHKGERGSETWENGSLDQSGAANVWTSMTADPERDLVFLPISAASPDFFGGDRPGDNLFSDSLVALRASTGEYVWHYQTVHHDVWDYDLPAPPVLITLERDGRLIDAVAQPTKTGFVFVFDRETGEPLFPIEERPVPQSDIPEEKLSKTQPFPVRPPALVPQRITPETVWAPTESHAKKCRKALSGLRNEGLFTPPTTRGTVVYPFTAGGANWSGASFDPVRKLLVVPVNNDVHIIKLNKVADKNVSTDEGRPMASYFRSILFLLTGKGTGLRYQTNPLFGRSMLRAGGLPCNKPPWGELVAVDLQKGEIAWRRPTGAENGIEGIVNFGPSLVTAGGLVFHAGTRERSLRAHDVESGDVLARFELPAGLHAGPVTYRTAEDGKQFLVVAPGGHIGLGSKLGDYLIAYTLP